MGAQAAQPRYTRLAGITRNRFPWLDRVAYRGYSMVFDLFAVGLTKPGVRRKIMGALCRASLTESATPNCAGR